MPNPRRGDPPKKASPRKAPPKKAAPTTSGKKPAETKRAALDTTPPQFTEINDLFLLHTTESGGGEDLIAFMERAGDRSHHYIVDDDAHGNTVYDLVDTDLASWSAKGANHRSVNLAFGQLPETGNTHTDVGPNFPWDLFAADVASFAISSKGTP
jgi:N-acetyl-anhydromuramyl-L-alanine amidase AmpD